MNIMMRESFKKNEQKNRVRLLIFTLFATNLAYADSNILFQENFDAQEDWHSSLPQNARGGLNVGGADIVQLATTHELPLGWDIVRQVPAWAPSRGHPDRHEVIEILAENSNKAMGGQGKSFVTWRDSDDTKGSRYWNSDGVLGKFFEDGLDEVYVEFWITMSNEMIGTYYNKDYKNESTGSGKFFRIYHWNPDVNGPFEFYGGNSNPHMIWGISGRPSSNNGYGLRNNLSFLTRRDGSSEGKYIDADMEVAVSEPSSYRTDIEKPNSIPDLRDGGLIDSGAVDIDQVFGDESNWVKLAFYVKMNSEPGIYDGVFKQWINDHRIQNISSMNWVESERNMVKWNVIALGGNDWFNKYPSESRIEEWYAIDDVLIASTIPDYLINYDDRPGAPSNVTVREQ